MPKAVGWLGSGLQAEEELRCVVWALNGDSLFALEQPATEREWQLYDKLLREAPGKLQQLVEAWNRSGRNLKTMWRDSYVTALYIHEFSKKHPVRLAWAGTGTDVDHPFLDRHGRTPDEEAARLFLTLIFNPQKEKLGGPCSGCGRYYIRRTAGNTTYCSRSCGTRATAIATTKRRRAREHDDKMRRARLAAEQWAKLQRTGRTKKGWKEWVFKAEPDIKPNFLTRAVNRGELKEPVRQ